MLLDSGAGVHYQVKTQGLSLLNMPRPQYVYETFSLVKFTFNHSYFFGHQILQCQRAILSCHCCSLSVTMLQSQPYPLTHPSNLKKQVVLGKGSLQQLTLRDV